MSEAYKRERAVAVDAVREAAALCQAVQSEIDPDVLKKRDRTPVTVADFGSQAVICRALREAFPNDPVIAEEDATALRQSENEAVLQQVVERVQASRPDADTEALCDWIDHGTAKNYHDRFWTLDPIDGTKGFIRGDQYAIALALIVEGAPRVAALCCPNLPDELDLETANTRGQVFLAVRDTGVLQLPVQPNADAPPIPVHVSDTKNPAGGRFTDSFVSTHSAHDMAVEVGGRLGITADPIRIDSQAKYALVARGNAEIYFRLPRPGSTYTERIWDHAAGSLVVEAAGGRVTDMHGEPLDFTHGPLLSENEGIVATNGRFHDQVLEALKTVGS